MILLTILCMKKIDLRKPHLCHVCGKNVGKFFYKKWWCTHNKYLEGICNEQRKRSSKKKSS